jgi:lysophospholipase L1-like esterase
MKLLSPMFAFAFVAMNVGNILASEVIVKDGDKVAFLGDSITQFGAEIPGGYCRLVVAGLEANGIKVEPVFSGIGGNTSIQMLERIERDVLAKKPTLMTLSCGVNDVYRVPLEAYKTNIMAIVEKVRNAGVKLVILTPTMAGEDPRDGYNKKLAGYVDFLRGLAQTNGWPLADLNSQMQAALREAKATNATKPYKAYYLTKDGIHMATQGDQLMAEGVLRVFGLDDAQIGVAKAAWLDIPNSTKVEATGMISIRDYNKIAADARKEDLSVDEYLSRKFAKTLETILAK